MVTATTRFFGRSPAAHHCPDLGSRRFRGRARSASLLRMVQTRYWRASTTKPTTAARTLHGRWRHPVVLSTWFLYSGAHPSFPPRRPCPGCPCRSARPVVPLLPLAPACLASGAAASGLALPAAPRWPRPRTPLCRDLLLGHVPRSCPTRHASGRGRRRRQREQGLGAR